jgi:nucleoside-diphosphate-sugar epimerase
MTVLITGGDGYIGSHMVLELADAGEPVVVLDNRRGRIPTRCSGCGPARHRRRSIAATAAAFPCSK